MLNNEKMTPYFLSLIKGSKKEESLDQVVNDDGTPFNSSKDRNNFIKNTFADLYKIPDDELELNGDSISNFLGPVAEHPTITEAKLTDNEKNSLETALTIIELDRSIENAKLKSAPGADGFSNCFIKEYWQIFRTPLHKLALKCYAENKLTDPFRSTEIKLIPKKGDITRLKNWRPISMLNCFYKIISRAISTRIKKFMDKLTPVCQKGYSSTRRCQEVLIQLLENIENCKKLGKKQQSCLLTSKRLLTALDTNTCQKSWISLTLVRI